MQKIDLQIFNWSQIQQYYQKTKTQKQVLKKYHISRTLLNRAKEQGKFIVKKFIRKHSQKTKKLLSMKRKKYLSQHPQNHVWKKNTKFNSPPCEYLKQFLRKNRISFVEQYTNYRDWGHNYSIDIAFVNQKIGIQINGQMHYQRNGQLKEYYQKRHNYLQSCCWKIYQFHYSLVYNTNFQNQLIKLLLNNIDLTFDYNKYVKQVLLSKKLQFICSICGGVKRNKYSKCCVNCANKKPRTSKIANVINNSSVITEQYYKNEQKKLEQLVKQHNLEQIGRMLGVTGNAIKKRCLKYGINYKQYKSKLKSNKHKNNI